MRIGNISFPSYRVSIQQRLTLLICTLLLSTIVIYGLANYFSLKEVTLLIGKERLSSLTKQVSSMLGANSQTVIKNANKIAAQNSTILCLKSGGRNFNNETTEALGKLRRDSNWVSTALLSKNLVPVLHSGKPTESININLNYVLATTKVMPDSGRVGKIYTTNGQMYYPLVTAVTEKKEILGYIISWVLVKSDPRSVAQFSRLVGSGAGLYIANSDWSLWTDMIKPISNPPYKINLSDGTKIYVNSNGKRMMVGSQPIPGTNWVIIIEFSEQIILNAMNSFVNWIFIIGVILTTVGVFAAWVMSRNITKPLKKLTVAASAISNGNYFNSVSIDTERSDELGELAKAFNIMADEVYHTWQNLDNKVKERTQQLELANKDLEAFSYSISHDLRTPLRAIIGYSNMLCEDYNPNLDYEGRRITGNIVSNAKMMGQLIDDLLSFSQLGRKELVLRRVDMQKLVINVVEELVRSHPEKEYQITISELPPAFAEQGMIKQAFVNLIGNAIKYSSKKSKPEIEIGFIDDSAKTTYYIKDNGVGFDMAYAGKLFGVFQRLHSLAEFEGTGVGLALVKRIIDKHNGQIWAEAIENVGATFFFSLPKNLNHE